MTFAPQHTDELTADEIVREIENIRWLKARRIRALDEHTWDVYEALHIPEYYADNDGEAPVRGSAVNAARLKKFYDAVGMVSVHHVHSHEILLTGATTATGVWAMEDRLFWHWNGRDHSLHGFGFYHETYERRGGAWMFATRRLRRIRETRSPGAEMPEFFTNRPGDEAPAQEQPA